MNTEMVDKIANAVLYEGYMLYPYRRSAVKNQQRFNFGVLYPRQYSEQQEGTDNWQMQIECLALGSAEATVEVKVRCLQMVDENAIEREVYISLFCFDEQPRRQEFKFDDLNGEWELQSRRLEDCFRVRLILRNTGKVENLAAKSRDEILAQSFISVHAILHIEGGSFISLIDPPERFRSPAAECTNIGAWPVLVGAEGQVDTILAAPIILYDYPQIAPESAGDLFDGTEIDEILQLRILTMTDAEKEEVRNGDDRTRQILERTELLPPEHFQKLHGALRGMKSPSEETL
jgi:hypothetical protein